MWTHGISGYKYGCRCDTCVTDTREYHRAYRAAHPRKRAYSPPDVRRWRQARQQRIRETHENRDKLPGRDRKAIKPIEIFERDGWVCHICGKAIDPEAKRPDVWAASIDHVVSLASGGTHTRDNMAASHLICNMRKG